MVVWSRVDLVRFLLENSQTLDEIKGWRPYSKVFCRESFPLNGVRKVPGSFIIKKDYLRGGGLKLTSRV